MHRNLTLLPNRVLCRSNGLHLSGSQRLNRAPCRNSIRRHHHSSILLPNQDRRHSSIRCPHHTLLPRLVLHRRRRIQIRETPNIIDSNAIK